MRLSDMRRCSARLAVVAALSGAMISAAVPAAAYADTKTDLAAAREKLEQIGAETDRTSAQLDSLNDQLNQTEYDISEKQDNLAKSQEKLSKFVSSDYKDGGTSLLAAFTGTSDLSDMFSRLFYVNKVADTQAEAIQAVKTAKKELESKEAEQKRNVTQLQKTVDDLNSQRSEAADVVNSLDAQLKEELQKEAEENARLQAAMQASQEQQVQAVAKSSSSNNSSTSNSGSVSSGSGSQSTGSSHSTSTPSSSSSSTSGSSSSSSSSSSKPSSSSSGSSSSSSSSTSSSNVNGGSVVSRAYSKLGSPYVWGACGPTSFDCSGFVSYCLTGSYTRLGTTYTFMGWTRVSNPQPGDVCTSATHCGIYIGNGQMIHASRPGVGVIIGPVQSNMIIVRR